MRVIDHINNASKTAFSFEVLPPLKGNNIRKLYENIDRLMEFEPKYINITSHRDEVVFFDNQNGLYERKVVRKRPGTVAVAAAIKNKYNITVVPHLICGGFSKDETEYALIDLNFLGIYDLLLLRGDFRHKDKYPKQKGLSHAYAIELIEQVNQFNDGNFLDGRKVARFPEKFTYGVAGYPEKHEEAPNIDSDIYYLKKKVDAGAEYIVSQMFFDNNKYYKFVEKCRLAGIKVPIVPGLKPITLQNQLRILPQIFKTDIPEDLAKEIRKCKTEEQVAALGVEWGIFQANDLKEHNVPVIHFYTMMAEKSVRKIAKAVF